MKVWENWENTKAQDSFKINVTEEEKFLLEFLSVLFLPAKEIQKLIAKLL